MRSIVHFLSVRLRPSAAWGCEYAVIAITNMLSTSRKAGVLHSQEAETGSSRTFPGGFKGQEVGGAEAPVCGPVYACGCWVLTF